MEKDPLKELINKDFKQKVPSFDFTQNVMQKIEQATEQKTVIEPLISKRTWWFIGTFYLSLLILPFFIGVQESSILFLEQISFGGFNYQNVKENLHIISQVIFVFAALTLGDLFLKPKKWA